MSKRAPPKVVVPRPPKIKTDDRGRSVWVDTINTAKLELVSTQTLKKMLSSDERKAIEEAVDQPQDGVLARDTQTGMFEIIDDDELRAILDSEPTLPPVKRPTEITLEPLGEETEAAADELSLVSTQVLRKMLGVAEPKEDVAEVKVERSFNPYDNS